MRIFAACTSINHQVYVLPDDNSNINPVQFVFETLLAALNLGDYKKKLAVLHNKDNSNINPVQFVSETLLAKLNLGDDDKKNLAVTWLCNAYHQAGIGFLLKQAVQGLSHSITKYLDNPEGEQCVVPVIMDLGDKKCEPTNTFTVTNDSKTLKIEESYFITHVCKKELKYCLTTPITFTLNINLNFSNIHIDQINGKKVVKGVEIILTEDPENLEQFTRFVDIQNWKDEDLQKNIVIKDTKMPGKEGT